MTLSSKVLNKDEAYPIVIRQTLVKNVPGFRLCFQQNLNQSDAPFKGIVKLNFFIGTKGDVRRPSMSSIDKLPENAIGCILKTLKSITFPKPANDGEVEVSQPMNLYPQAKK